MVAKWFLVKVDKMAAKKATVSKATQKKVATAKKEGTYMGFAAVEKAAAKGGAKNPAAVAAAVGRKKYGKAGFQQLAQAGKKAAKKGK